MRAIDTNVLVRLLVRDDREQVKAAEEFVAAGAFVSHLVLVEAMWVLNVVYTRSADDIMATVGMLLRHNALVLQDPETVAAALDEFRARPALGFSDCLILQTARKAGQLPLGTFDHALAKRPDVTRL